MRVSTRESDPWVQLRLFTGLIVSTNRCPAFAKALGTGTNNLTGDKLANEELFAYFEKEIPVVMPVLKTQLEYLDKLCGNWPVAKDAEIKNAFYPELQSALLGQKSAKDALADAEKKVNRVLQKR